MVIAKIFIGPDNLSFMHNDYPNCCEICHYELRQSINANFKLKKKQFDVSGTYDGYLIVSKRFRLFCEEKKYNNVQFLDLPNEPDFYFLESTTTITLDYERRKVQFIDFCDKCGRYAEVIGATPSFIKPNSTIKENTFYRSEYDFGSYNSKSPLIVVSNKMAEEMLEMKFKGLYFKDVLE